MKNLLQQMTTVWTLPHHEFVLRYGRDYQIDRNSFAGPRGQPKMCFMNATLLALRDHSLTYVEGFVSVRGIPISHAWCAKGDHVIDPTLVLESAGDKHCYDEYFGVPFHTEYLIKATLRNGVYGLLDEFANKTAPKLFELGLEAGQQWLSDQCKQKAK